MNRRMYPSVPIVGVGAAVFRESEVLLIKRAKPPIQNVWTLPGGRVLENETLLEGARREILEECNINIHVRDLIDIFEYIQKDKNGKTVFHYLVFDFLAIYKSGKTEARSDAIDAIWIRVDRLNDYTVTEKAREIILKGFRMLKQK